MCHVFYSLNLWKATLPIDILLSFLFILNTLLGAQIKAMLVVWADNSNHLIENLSEARDGNK